MAAIADTGGCEIGAVAVRDDLSDKFAAGMDVEAHRRLRTGLVPRPSDNAPLADLVDMPAQRAARGDLDRDREPGPLGDPGPRPLDLEPFLVAWRAILRRARDPLG